MSEPTDERAGLPSASSIERMSLCPASYQMSKVVRDIEEDESWTTSGTRIHDKLEGKKVDLTRDENDVYKACVAGRNQILDKLFPFGWQGDVKETRLWMKDGAGKAIFSGKVDHIAEGNNHIAVIDYKTGRIPVTPPQQNLQLQSYAMLIAEENPSVEKASVVVIQPVAGGVTHHTFTRGELRIVKSKILDILSEANGPNPQIIPGRKQCQYCPAKGQCKESVAIATSFNGISSVSYTPDEAGEILERIALSRKAADKIEAYFKAELADNPKAVTGWRLATGSQRRTITNPERVLEFLKSVNLVEDIPMSKNTSMSMSDVRRAVKEHSPDVSDKELNSLLDASLSDALETKRSKPTLKKNDE